MLGEDESPRTYAIIGAMIEVHKILGNGFLEAVYQHALAAEFRRRGIPFEREVHLEVRYKGEVLPASYRADFVCYGEVLLELKSQVSVGNPEHAQLIHYLKATGKRVGLLANFGRRSLEVQRFVADLLNGRNEVAVESI